MIGKTIHFWVKSMLIPSVLLLNGKENNYCLLAEQPIVYQKETKMTKT